MRDYGLQAQGMDPWQKHSIDGLEIAVRAVDWRGHEQVSWVVGYDSHRITHCGEPYRRLFPSAAITSAAAATPLR